MGLNFVKAAESRRRQVIWRALKWWVPALAVLGFLFNYRGAGPSRIEEMSLDIERFRRAKSELEACVAKGAQCSDADRARLGRELAQAEGRYNRWMGTTRR